MANSKLKTAREARKYIGYLEELQERLYTEAVKELDVEDDGWAVDYFFNNVGIEKFEARLDP